MTPRFSRLAPMVALLASLEGAAIAGAQSFVPVASPAIAAHVAFSTGASWVDFDDDGDLDLFVVVGFSANRDDVLYRNDGGSFTRLTGIPIVEDHAESVCSTWADFDNDGDLDAFVSHLVDQGGRLYRATAPGELALDVASGVGGAGLKGVGAAWGDYDNDGHLDLVVAALDGQGGITTGNRLFHNDGDGTFTEITSGAVVTTRDTHHHPTWSDYDGDGDLDLFFATGPVGALDRDRLYRNRLAESGAATFEAIAGDPIASDFRDSQVLSWVDYDDDGDLDLYAINYTTVPNQLYRNDGGTFSRVTAGAIVTDQGAAHGVVWGDFDNDGDQDAYVARDLQQSNRYYRNEGGGVFTSIVTGGFVQDVLSNYAACAGDYDRDGDLDLFVPTARSEGPSVLYRNDLGNGNGWLVITPRGAFSNRSGIGAKVRIRATIGGAPRWQMRELRAGTSYGGHDAVEAHFGLGDATLADTVRVEWPSGLVDVIAGVAANQRRTVLEGETFAGVTERVSPIALSVAPNPVNARSHVAFDLARPARVRLDLFDATGRRLATLDRGLLETGRHALGLDGIVPSRSGVYVLRLRAGGTSATRRLVRL